MPLRVVCQHSRRWYQSPLLRYRVEGGDEPLDLDVNVTGSSLPLKGSKLATPVVKVLLGLRKKPEKTRILDFGAGTWLRYVHKMQRILPDREIFFVEHRQAFAGADPEIQIGFDRAVNGGATFWTPEELSRAGDNERFHVILAVNVFNTMPEPGFRAAAYEVLARHLYPGGWLVVYQRKWATTDLPKAAKDDPAEPVAAEPEPAPRFFPYADGWMLPHDRHPYATYRASTGYGWFNRQAAQHGLRHLARRIKMTSSNTIFRTWQTRLA